MSATSCVFSDLAEGDLTDIALHIAAESPARALRFVAAMRARCETLIEQPKRNQLREEYGAGIRVAVHGRFLVFYAERGETIVIERILHGARHLDWVRI